MRLYRFSPIITEKQLLKAVKYIVRQNTILCKKITGKTFAISYVTVFSHFPAEYQKLKNICSKIGSQVSENNGPKFELRKPIKIGKLSVGYLRIRNPDPYRMQVGCCDFVVEYDTVKELLSKTKNLRNVKRPDMEMIEFFHPDFDVLSYVVKK